MLERRHAGGKEFQSQPIYVAGWKSRTIPGKTGTDKTRPGNSRERLNHCTKRTQSIKSTRILNERRGAPELSGGITEPSARLVRAVLGLPSAWFEGRRPRKKTYRKQAHQNQRPTIFIVSVKEWGTSRLASCNHSKGLAVCRIVLPGKH